MLFCSTVFGQSHWSFTSTYQHNMTISASVTVDGILPTEHDGFELAAFHNNSLRGVCVADYFPPTGEYVFTLTIGGIVNGEEIKFKLFDPTNGENGKELSTNYTVEFLINHKIGNALDPINIDFYERHWESNEEYENTMSIVSTIKIDGVTQNRTDIEVAAFCGEELRGATRVEQLGNTDIYIAAIYIGGNDGETISFKLYDPTINLELNSEYTTEFITNEIIGDEEPFSMNFVYNSVAKIGDVYYNTLAEAVEEAEAGATLTLLKNANGKGIVINKDITIDFAGFTYTFSELGVGSGTLTSNGFQILKENTVTLKNGKLQVADEMKSEYYILVQNYADLTVEGMTLDGTNLDKWSATDGDSYTLSNNSGYVDIYSSTIKANDEGDKAFAFDACKYQNYEAPVVTLWGNDNHVTGKVELTGGSIIGNTADGLEVVAKKEFKAVTGGQGSTAGWGTISTPVYTEGNNGVEIPAGNHDLYKYDEEAASWRFYTGQNAADPFTTFDLGIGYLYANTEDITIELQGKLANGKEVSFPLSYTQAADPLAGFNFIGNPYACNINLDNLEIENYTLANGFYVVSEDGALVASEERDVIRPMESVMIQIAPKDGAKVSYEKAKLTVTPSPLRKGSEIDNGSLAINVSNANYSDVAYVSFIEGLGLDKISHRNAEIPMVYVPVDGVNYAIAMMSQDVTEIPVSFQAATMGQYTIGVEAQDCEYAMMTLVDRFTGIETNLLLEDYTFIAKSNDSAERFIIKLAMDNSNGEANENFAFINNGMMYIYNIEGQGVVSVYDVTGRPVAEYNVATSANISTSDFAAGMYIIRMSDENGVKTQKIVVE